MSAGDVERLAEVLASHEEIGGGWYCSCTPIDPDTDGHELVEERSWEAHLAAAVLASDWLAAHDAEVAARARREALLEAADEFHDRGQSHVNATDASRAYRDAWTSAARELRARADREGQGREGAQ